MDIIDKYIPFVKEQIFLQEKLARKFADTPWRNQLHLKNLDTLKQLSVDIDKTSNYIKELESRPNIPTVSLTQQLNLSYEEIQGLPEELIQELSISDNDRTEFVIRNIIDEAGGISSLDRILYNLYKKTNEVHKRNTVTSRLYRMSQKGLVFSVPNKKGVYSTQELTSEDVERIFNKTEKSNEIPLGEEAMAAIGAVKSAI